MDKYFTNSNLFKNSTYGDSESLIYFIDFSLVSEIKQLKAMKVLISFKFWKTQYRTIGDWLVPVK